MSTLDRALRKVLADTITSARPVSEEAAHDAIRRLGVVDDEPPTYLTAEQKALRVRLRAHARSLGDGWNRERKKLLSTRHLENEAAYEIWHRMLFGRFLVERGLLIHPELGEPIAPSELADLAKEEGEADQWALVERFAAPSLPAVFKPNDPVLAMTLDPALARRLRDFVTGLPTEVFTADDALGWTYQFWRTSEKDAVNKGGGKVGPDELPAVTQLFTERYMVQFLLHNTLGAWWAGKRLTEEPDLAGNATSEQQLRQACALPGISWDYLRFIREGENGPWRPAAGTFRGWPETAAQITYCDPCCGSGHFLVEAFLILSAMRRAEEGLSDAEAAQAVLRDNLHGLELDGRCVQIAAFNVALTAWKFAAAPIPLPHPRIAWVGAPPPMSQYEMTELGGLDPSLTSAFRQLHDQFSQAPLLGSLLEVGARDLLDADLRESGSVALSKLRAAEPERVEGAIAAQGLLEAAELLGRRYVLIATNVPFLGRGKQDPDLAKYISRRMPEAKADLATAMLQRMRAMVARGGAIASVAPQQWLFLGAYRRLREELLHSARIDLVAGLGSRAFETITGEMVNVALSIITEIKAMPSHLLIGIDANSAKNAEQKANYLLEADLHSVLQDDQKKNPQAAISTEASFDSILLRQYATAIAGVNCGDEPHYGRVFWEIGDNHDRRWSYQVSAPDRVQEYSGYSYALLWENNSGALRKEVEEKLGVTGANAWLRGSAGWGKLGVTSSLMKDLPVTLFSGSLWDGNTGVIIPRNIQNLPAIWTFCSSGEYKTLIRKMNRKVSITLNALVDVPFDLHFWSERAAVLYPSGLPKPYSDDPTHWIFHGHPAFAEQGTQLHVALARVVGYKWPAETDTSLLLSDLAQARVALAAKLPEADADGLLPLHATGADRALADRLRALLAEAYGGPLTPAQESGLVQASDSKLDRKEARDASLETWVRERAFRQHCVLFQNRPFLWQVWDGLRDGFSAFVDYHRLDHAALERLTFTLLGDWISKARAEGRTAHEERARQLQQRLRAVLDGEQPYDIFVRWKPIWRQPVGWNPDLDDGVRLNIRPFMKAEVLREQPRINWNKDRGTNAPSAPWRELGLLHGGNEGDRINDHHLTLAEKRAAQSEAKTS